MPAKIRFGILLLASVVLAGCTVSSSVAKEEVLAKSQDAFNEIEGYRITYNSPAGTIESYYDRSLNASYMSTPQKALPDYIYDLDNDLILKKWQSTDTPSTENISRGNIIIEEGCERMKERYGESVGCFDPVIHKIHRQLITDYLQATDAGKVRYVGREIVARREALVFELNPENITHSQMEEMYGKTYGAKLWIDNQTYMPLKADTATGELQYTVESIEFGNVAENQISFSGQVVDNTREGTNGQELATRLISR